MWLRYLIGLIIIIDVAWIIYATGYIVIDMWKIIHH